MREELLEIYSSSGKKTGKKATKSYIHKKGLFHATVHVWIFSEKGNVLIQKRSTKKKLNPGVWDVSVAGHIGYKEDIKAAAIRETFEETGWKIQPVKRLGFFHRFVYMPEYSKWAQKVCHIYICKGLYNLTSPLEKGHKALLMKPREAVCLLESPGDRIFVKNYFGRSTEIF